MENSKRKVVNNIRKSARLMNINVIRNNLSMTTRKTCTLIRLKIRN